MGIRLTCKDPRIKELPEVREYLKKLEKQLNDMIEEQMVTFAVFGSYQMMLPELPDIQALNDHK